MLILFLQHGRNCLHLACHYGKLETVQVIMNMEVVTIDCTSKVIYTAANAEFIPPLLQRASPVFICPQRGFTPLHEASGEGHVRVVFYLLAMGAYLKARSSEGWTALMSAAYNGHVDVAKILIAAGLNVNATNKVRVYSYITHLPLFYPSFCISMDTLLCM